MRTGVLGLQVLLPIVFMGALGAVRRLPTQVAMVVGFHHPNRSQIGLWAAHVSAATVVLAVLVDRAVLYVGHVHTGGMFDALNQQAHAGREKRKLPVQCSPGEKGGDRGGDRGGD
jgi:hypothetical protein